MKAVLYFAAVVTAWLLASSSGLAHAPSTSYLTLNIDEYAIKGRIEVNLLDLSQVLSIDLDDDGRVTWGELRQNESQLVELFRNTMRFSSEGAQCDLSGEPLLVDRKLEGIFAVLPVNIDCPVAPIESLRLDYDYLFDVNADHRAFINLIRGEVRQSKVLKSNQRSFEVNVGEDALFGTFSVFVREGIFHIVEGIDHVLFLIALLLPAVFLRDKNGLRPVESLRTALWTTFKVITSFTIAHSLTLALVSFKAMPFPPTRYVESLVAATILFTALHNIFPVFLERRWLVGFGFGLIHGIGYSSILEDLGLTTGEMVVALFGFNVGVELAQAGIVLVVIPIMFILRKQRLYYLGVYQIGSIITAGLALSWMIDRLFELKMMPF